MVFWRESVVEGQTEEQFWSRFSDTYDKDGEYVTGRPVLEAIASRLSREPSSGQALEFGCGTGFFSQAIAQTDGHLLATDLSEAMLKTARRRLGNLPNVTLRKAGCSAGSFAAGSFDSVFLVTLGHVLDDPFPCLRECHRVLRPGGALVAADLTFYGVSLLHKLRLVFRYLRTWGPPPRRGQGQMSPDALAALFSRAGFKVTDVQLIREGANALYLRGVKA